MKAYFILWMFLLVIPASISPESQEAQIVKLKAEIELLEKTIRRAEKMVNRLEKQLAEQQKENRRLLALCRKAKINTKQITGAEADEIGKQIQVPLNVGQIIYFDRKQNFKIEQIIDKQNLIAEARIASVPIYGPMGESRFLTRIPIKGYKTISRIVWISGLNTSDYADGIVVKPAPSHLFKITETKSYDTLFTGVKTLFVLEPFISAPD